jgi:DNA polymerase III delta prime subunit
MKAREILELEAKNGTFSHAYLLIGENDEAEELVNIIVSAKKCINEDIIVLKPEQKAGKAGEIGVEEIREILRRVSRSSQNGTKIVTIYNSEKLNQSSGNILLKNLEEPPNDTIFILIAENESVLPTIKSRCRQINLTNQYVFSPTERIENLKKGFFEASELIEKVVKEEETNQLLDELQSYFYQKLLVERNIESVTALKEIERVKKEIIGNANQKLALEGLYLELESTI